MIIGSPFNGTEMCFCRNDTFLTKVHTCVPSAAMSSLFFYLVVKSCSAMYAFSRSASHCWMYNRTRRALCRSSDVDIQCIHAPKNHCPINTFNAIACEKHAILPDRICQITAVQNFIIFEFFHHEHYETVANTVILGRLCITSVGPWWLQLPGIIIAAGA